MKKKEILELFYKELNSYFQDWGFDFYKSKLKAIMKQGGITKTIYFDAIYFLGRASFQPYFWIRNEEIMVVRANVNERYKNDFFVTVNKHSPEVAKYYGREDLNFLFDHLNEEDLGSYVYDKTMSYYKAHFVKFMEEIGLKFFELFYTNKDFDKWFNEGIFDGKYNNLRINQDTTPIYSYISAYLVGNPCADDIYNYWMNYDLYEEAKEEIIRVKEHLEKK